MLQYFNDPMFKKKERKKNKNLQPKSSLLVIFMVLKLIIMKITLSPPKNMFVCLLYVCASVSTINLIEIETLNREQIG